MESAERKDDPVRRYLAQLSAELEPQDAALRHDALVDAEAHLRAAVAAGVAPERAVAEYGTPAEIAAAYGADGGAPGIGRASAGTARPKRRLRRIPVLGIWFDPRAWGALAYFGVIGFPLALAYFTWTVTIGALAVGSLPLVFGLPLAVFLLGSVRAICLFEGKVVEFFLQVRMPRRTQLVEGATSVGFWQRVRCWLRDVRSWLSLAYLLGNFPVSVAAFAVTVAVAATGAALAVLPTLCLFGFPAGTVHADDGDPIRFRLLWHDVVPDADGRLWLTPGESIPVALVGLALLTALLWAVRGLGWVYGHVVQAIQVSRPRPGLPPATLR